MVAKVLGGSLASIPSNALDNETIKRSVNMSPPSISTGSTGADREVRNSERPTNATDIKAIFSWWVAVIWLDIKVSEIEVNFLKQAKPKGVNFAHNNINLKLYDRRTGVFCEGQL
jgi:hypothetical protein